ncbi:MAG: leucine--tRNA ligase [Candidatus Aenigmatarchaeota archaeon]
MHMTMEDKWKKRWKQAKIFDAKDGKGKKYYILEMFPYPSGHAGHVGHARNYMIGDSLVRFMRMNGFNVLYPMGWDAFGQPSENAAIKEGIHPAKSVAQNIKNFKDQLDALSISYDWSREVTSCDPDYYRWNQWLFLKLLEHGLAYKKFAAGNWCECCGTILSNEDAEGGKCWRCDSEVVQKEIDQWFFKITDYAERLLSDMEKIDWSERLKTMQRNWIGKSSGVNLTFKVKGCDLELKTFTTRPDTYFGITFVVIAPEHPLIKELTKDVKNKKEIEKFIEDSKNLSELQRTMLTKEKKGIFTGKYIVNPITKEEIPIWVANYVVATYGTGMVIGVPTQDQRDFEFAKAYDLGLKNVINPTGKQLKESEMNAAYVNEGVMTNSEQFNGMNSKEAIVAIADFLVKKGYGERIVNYKIRDWCISRQKYWGTPIPIIYCGKCGIVPVPEKDLPVVLPLDVKFGKKGAPPLATNKDFVNVKCPKCKGKAKRETDTMTTFVDSAWYFLRYTSPKYDKAPFDKEKVNFWMPVDQYIGGSEHAVGHLMYSRFITKFLKDKGYLNFDEPFMHLLNQGMVNKGGVKMSKSKGNVIDPRDMIKVHGLDTLRTYLLFMADPMKTVEWSDEEMAGVSNFLKKVMKLKEDAESCKAEDKYIESVTQRKIDIITKNISGLQPNTAIIELMDFANKLSKHPSLYAYKIFLKMLTPFAPHTTEEMWEALGEKEMISVQKWPEADPSKINLKEEAGEELISNIISDVEEIKKLSKIENPMKITIFVAPAWKHEVYSAVVQGLQIKDIIKNYKGKEKDVSNYFMKVQKRRPNEEKMMKGHELKHLQDYKDYLEKELKTKVEVLSAENSTHPKAFVAEPEKPGILVE